MAVPVFWNLVTGLGGGYMQVQFPTVLHKGTQLLLGAVGSFFKPNKMLVPFFGGGTIVRCVMPQKITGGVRAFNNNFMKLRQKRVCAVLKIEVCRKSGRCADLSGPEGSRNGCARALNDKGPKKMGMQTLNVDLGLVLWCFY